MLRSGLRPLHFPFPGPRTLRAGLKWEVLGILGLAVAPGNEAPFLAPVNPGIRLPDSGLFHTHRVPLRTWGQRKARDGREMVRDRETQDHRRRDIDTGIKRD